MGASLSEEEYTKVSEDVWISRTADVAPTASIAGPTIIGHKAEIRHCAYIRGSVVVGESAIVGCGSNIYPLSMVRGYVPPNSIYKRQGEVVNKR